MKTTYVDRKGRHLYVYHPDKRRRRTPEQILIANIINISKKDLREIRKAITLERKK